MEKDVIFLLEEEKRACEETSRDTFTFDDEYVEDPHSFLHDHPISIELDRISSGDGLSKEIRSRYGITDAEEIVFWLIIGKYSYIIKNTQSSPCRQKIINLWEQLLQKIPVHRGPVLHRVLTDERFDFSQGDMWLCRYSLTCTTNDWPLNRDENTYEIHLLPNGLTKARNVYEIYNHGASCDNPENQVNFPKGTSFRIVDVQKMPNNGTKVIMEEL